MIAAVPVRLVIDDKPGMLALVERAVRSTGFQAILYTDAGEALAGPNSISWRGNATTSSRCSKQNAATRSPRRRSWA
jgi:hypothetical protein